MSFLGNRSIGLRCERTFGRHSGLQHEESPSLLADAEIGRDADAFDFNERPAPRYPLRILHRDVVTRGTMYLRPITDAQRPGRAPRAEDDIHEDKTKATRTVAERPSHSSQIISKSPRHSNGAVTKPPSAFSACMPSFSCRAFK